MERRFSRHRHHPADGRRIHPRGAADHHQDIARDLLNSLLERHGLDLSELGGVAFQGPGMGPCLRVGAGITGYQPLMMFL